MWCLLFSGAEGRADTSQPPLSHEDEDGRRWLALFSSVEMAEDFWGEATDDLQELLDPEKTGLAVIEQPWAAICAACGPHFAGAIVDPRPDWQNMIGVPLDPGKEPMDLRR